MYVSNKRLAGEMTPEPGASLENMLYTADFPGLRTKAVINDMRQTREGSNI